LRRRLTVALGATLVGGLGVAVPGRSHAQAAAGYPAKSVKIVVAFTAGGTTDIIARAVAQKLSESLKQSFVIDNKPGAGGNLGTEFTVRAPADGYTLIVNSVGPMAVNPSLHRKLSYDPLVDLTPVVLIADVPNVLVVAPDFPARTLEDFVAYAKANPGKLSYGSTGVGTAAHLSSVMFSKRVGADTQHVPYKGAEALNDLLAGRIQFMFATIPSVIAFIKAGKLLPLAVSSPKRSRSLPEVPAVAERGYPGFAAGSWFGMSAPKGTPPAIVATLNKAVNDALPSLEAQFVREGADPVGGTPAFYGQFIQQETEKWRTIVKESGATVD
jgi:tripartite-type tricarboxylate transporter receptor subunit TctC